MNFKEGFTSHINKFSTAPFLFVGSGISRRYLDLEDWESLLRKFAGVAKKPYEYYRSSGNNEYPLIATAIAEDIHKMWWTDDSFKESIEQFKEYTLDQESALKIEVSKHIKDKINNCTTVEILLKEIDLLRKSVIDGIITTNWDLFLEEIFSDFQTYIGQDELLFFPAQSIGEIYKIHGCCTKPNSIILTKKDYELFENRNPYLASKLITIFVEHPVIFLGYSLSDPNISDILKSIASCLTTKNIDQLTDRLIFVQWEPDQKAPVMEKATIVAGGFNLPVVSIRTSEYTAVFEVLSNIKRRFPARLLRQLKEHVYTLVKNNDPKNKLYVQDIDADTDLSEIDVVLGVGAIEKIQTVSSIGYTGISRRDLLEDIVNDKKLDTKKVVEESLPNLFKHGIYIPVFKYLRASGYLDKKGELLDTNLSKKVVEAAKANFENFDPPQYYCVTKRKEISKIKTFKKLVERYSRADIAFYVPFLKPENINHSDLLEFINSNMDLLDNGNSVSRTQFIKLICMYDWLIYKTEIKN